MVCALQNSKIVGLRQFGNGANNRIAGSSRMSLGQLPQIMFLQVAKCGSIARTHLIKKSSFWAQDRDSDSGLLLPSRIARLLKPSDFTDVIAVAGAVRVCLGKLPLFVFLQVAKFKSIANTHPNKKSSFWNQDRDSDFGRLLPPRIARMSNPQRPDCAVVETAAGGVFVIARLSKPHNPNCDCAVVETAGKMRVWECESYNALRILITGLQKS